MISTDFQIPRTNNTLKGTLWVRMIFWISNLEQYFSWKRSAQIFKTFTTEIRKLKLRNFSCRFCKPFVKDLEFINTIQWYYNLKTKSFKWKKQTIFKRVKELWSLMKLMWYCRLCVIFYLYCNFIYFVLCILFGCK